MLVIRCGEVSYTTSMISQVVDSQICVFKLPGPQCHHTDVNGILAFNNDNSAMYLGKLANLSCQELCNRSLFQSNFYESHHFLHLSAHRHYLQRKWIVRYTEDKRSYHEEKKCVQICVKICSNFMAIEALHLKTTSPYIYFTYGNNI